MRSEADVFNLSACPSVRTETEKKTAERKLTYLGVNRCVTEKHKSDGTLVIFDLEKLELFSYFG